MTKVIGSLLLAIATVAVVLWIFATPDTPVEPGSRGNAIDESKAHGSTSHDLAQTESLEPIDDEDSPTQVLTDNTPPKVLTEVWDLSTTDRLTAEQQAQFVATELAEKINRFRAVVFNDKALTEEVQFPFVVELFPDVICVVEEMETRDDSGTLVFEGTCKNGSSTRTIRMRKYRRASGETGIFGTARIDGKRYRVMTTQPPFAVVVEIAPQPVPTKKPNKEV